VTEGDEDMATNDQALTRTYGPMRKIVKLTKKNKTTSYVKLECGHRTTVKLSTTREQKRCYRCRPDVKARGAKREWAKRAKAAASS
jgi:hypothetical protein